MTITSLWFALFCGLAILIYWRLPARYRIPWLFAISIIFLLTWSWELTGILLVVATVNFLLGSRLGVAEKQRRFLLWIGVAFNIISLVGLKYSNFYVVGLAQLLVRFGFHTASGGLALLVPIGLSFTTVQMISYLVDIHNKNLKPESTWLSFATYVIYFPKLLSGPVERVRTLLPAMKQPKSLEIVSAERYAWLIVLGLIRKLVLADTIASMIPVNLFTQPGSYPAIELLVCLLGYAFVIYNDFAGYSNIVRGVSGYFGIELTNNFKLPYFSRNFTEFWGRWHVSLSNWLRDYIFFPSSRALLKRNPNRDAIIYLVLPPLLTMLVSGMWHGLGWNFLVWGGLHGIYLVFERVTTLRSPKRLPDEWPKWRQFLSTLGIFVLVILAWIPFRMDLATAWQYLTRVLTPSAWIRPDFWLMRMFLIGKVKINNWTEFKLPDLRILIMLLPALLLDWTQSRYKDEVFFTRWPIWAKALFVALLTLVLSLLSLSSTGASFVYQGF